jgi:hypothetical protein
LLEQIDFVPGYTTPNLADQVRQIIKQAMGKFKVGPLTPGKAKHDGEQGKMRCFGGPCVFDIFLGF